MSLLHGDTNSTPAAPDILTPASDIKLQRRPTLERPRRRRVVRYCYSIYRPYSEAAKSVWPDAEWISGQGRFAVLSHCRARLTVSLHPTAEAAEEALRMIDRTACGGFCCRDHEIVKLRHSLVRAAA